MGAAPLASARTTRTDPGTVDVSAGNTTVSAEDFHRNVLLVLTGTPSGALDLTVPAGKRLFIVQNNCGQDVAVTTGAGAQVLTSGQRRLLYGDGTNIVAVVPDFASTGGAQPTRLTVPAGKGITRAQVLCGVQWGASSSGDRWVEILKNDVEVDGLPGYLGPTDSSSRARIALTSALIAVADGNYFECLVWQNASGSLDVNAVAPGTCRTRQWPIGANRCGGAGSSSLGRGLGPLRVQPCQAVPHRAARVVQ
jgi:hypothetical protein